MNIQFVCLFVVYPTRGVLRQPLQTKVGENIEIATETNKQIHRYNTTEKTRFNNKMT